MGQAPSGECGDLCARLPVKVSAAQFALLGVLPLQLQHWKQETVTATLVDMLNSFMESTYNCGPLYDQADFALLGPALNRGDLGEGTGQLNPKTLQRE